jgi:putative heme-binding domain-containing protein
MPVLLQAMETSRVVAVRRAALSALESYDDPLIAERILARYTSFDSETLAAAQIALATRANWSRQLLAAIREARVSSRTLPLDVRRRIKLLKDENLSRSAEAIWPDQPSPSSAEIKTQTARWLAVARAGTGNPYRGRTLFNTTCAGCHRLFGNGGQVGPDLTPYERSDLENLLSQIVNPSLQIREGYETYNLETKDGRFLTGFLAEQDSQVVLLRALDGQTVPVQRKEIAELRVSPTSLMPEGLLDALTDQQTRDLLAYLRSSQPLVGKDSEPPKLP